MGLWGLKVLKSYLFLLRALLPAPARRFFPLLFLVPNSLFLFFPFFGRPPVNLSRIFLSSSEPPPTARALAMRNHRIANAFEAAFNFNRFLAHATDPSSSESSSAFEKEKKSQSKILHHNNQPTHQQQQQQQPAHHQNLPLMIPANAVRPPRFLTTSDA